MALDWVSVLAMVQILGQFLLVGMLSLDVQDAIERQQSNKPVILLI